MRASLIKRGVGLLIGLIAILIGLAFAFNSWQESHYTRFIEHNSQINLPSNISQFDVYDNAEFLFVAHMKLPNEEVEAFLQNNDFSPEFPSSRIIDTEREPNSFTLDFWTSAFRYLDSPNQRLPANADLQFVVDGCGRFVIDIICNRY